MNDEERDTVTIKTKFMKGVISKVLSKMISKNLNCDVTVDLSDIAIDFNGDKANVKVGGNVTVDKDNITKLFKDMI